MKWCSVSTSLALIPLLGSGFCGSVLAISSSVLAASGFNELLKIQSVQLVVLPEKVSGYKPPRDIGRPRRTGPSGGRVV